MALSTIISALEAHLASELPAVNVQIPSMEQPPTGDELPALIGEITHVLRITDAQLSIWQYRIELYYLHAERSRDYGGQIEVVLDMPRSIVTAMHNNATLGGLIYGPPTFEEPAVLFGTSPWRDKSYVGCMMPIIIKEKFAETFTTS